MKKDQNLQHVQLPNHMSEQNNSLKPKDLLVYAYLKKYMNKDTKTCYPSLQKLHEDSGASINFLRASIQNLVNAGYISTTKVGRGTLYTFLKWQNFEPFSYEFLDDKNTSFSEKAYIVSVQQYMFKDKDTQTGTITYSNEDLAKRINITSRTIKKLDKSLKEKGILESCQLTQRNQETYLPINQKTFHLDKVQQAIVFILGNHESRIQSTEKDVSDSKIEIEAIKKVLTPEQHKAFEIEYEKLKKKESLSNK